jgi:hypothetical protein
MTNQPRFTRWIAIAAQVMAAGIMLLGGIMNLTLQKPFIDSALSLGLSSQQVSIVGAIALTCIALYLVPRTSVLGAVLISAYFGGAIALHFRNNDAPANFLRALGVCGLLWLPIYLRNPTLMRLLPVKRATHEPV